jgi:uncharacterized protein YceK
MKISNVTVLSVIVFMLTSGCAAKIKRNFLNEPYQVKKISAALTVTGIEVVDARKSTDTATLIIPGFTFKSVGDTIIPPLSAEQSKIIKIEIAQYASGGKTAVRIKATITKGIKEYSMGFFNSREYALADVNIELLDTLNNTQLFSTTGEAAYETKSTRADTVFLESLYRKALKTCVYKAFESIQDYLEKSK